MFWKGLRAHRGTQINTYGACANSFIFWLHSLGGVGLIQLAVQARRSRYAIFENTLRVPFFGTLAMHVEPSVNIDALSSTGIRCHELTLGRPPANIFHGL